MPKALKFNFEKTADIENYNVVKIKDLLIIIKSIKNATDETPTNAKYNRILAHLDIVPLATNYYLKKNRRIFFFEPLIKVNSVDADFHDTSLTLRQHLDLDFSNFDNDCELLLNHVQFKFLKRILQVELPILPHPDTSTIRFLS